MNLQLWWKCVSAMDDIIQMRRCVSWKWRRRPLNENGPVNEILNGGEWKRSHGLSIHVTTWAPLRYFHLAASSTAVQAFYFRIDFFPRRCCCSYDAYQRGHTYQTINAQLDRRSNSVEPILLTGRSSVHCCARPMDYYLLIQTLFSFIYYEWIYGQMEMHSVHELHCFFTH